MHFLILGLLGLFIGVSLGALGGGGSILTVPALVYLLGEPATAATTGSLVIVGVTSLIGAFGHARSGHVRWAAGALFGLAGAAASVGGTVLNHAVDPNLLLLLFAALMLVAAAMMIRRGPRFAGWDRASGAQNVEPVGGTGGTSTAVAVRVQATRHDTARAAAKVTAAGLAVGFLTGFLGVGGGFIVVPALVMTLGFDMPVAVGTSLLVIAINAAAALASRAGTETFHWSVIVPFTIAAAAGSLGGKIVTDRAPERALTRAFATLLLAVAAYTAARSGFALA